jgi:type III secretion protein T
MGSDAVLFEEIRRLLAAALFGLPRLLTAMLLIPVLGRTMFPGLLRVGVAITLGLILIPMVVETMPRETFDPLKSFGIVIKEAFLGALIGYSVAALFWAVEAVGFFIDNQRGASIAATLNPLTGNDSSPLGILFNQAFVVFFMLSGGFLVFLGMLYESYRLWPVFEFIPRFNEAGMNAIVNQFQYMLKLGLLLAAPAIIVMFLAELGLALVSRFAPQLQVFFLAMPIKSAIALLTLVVYVGVMFDYTRDEILRMLPWLTQMDSVLR